MAYAKISSITNANMAKVNSAAKAAIGKIDNIDAPATSTPFTFTMNTENAGSATKTFVLPLVNATISQNMLVDWGDSSTSTITAHDDAEVTHVYDSTGTYTIQISGTISGWFFNYGGDKLKILVISQWGDFNFTERATFYGCTNLTCTATDIPTISTLNMSQAFSMCVNFNGAMANWDMSSVTSLSSMFYNAQAMNQDLSTWDVSSVTTLYQFIAQCTSFNNSSLANWDVSSVTDFSFAFNGATSFQGDLSDWDTGEATTMYSMFRDMTYNQDIGDWDTAKVETIGAMFRWNTSFNQDISDWDMGACTNMWGAFNYATAFEQNLGGWDIEACTEFANFLAGVTLTTENYDALLIGWNAQNPQDGEAPHFGGSKYTEGGDAEAARANLISEDGWTITDGGTA